MFDFPFRPGLRGPLLLLVALLLGAGTRPFGAAAQTPPGRSGADRTATPGGDFTHRLPADAVERARRAVRGDDGAGKDGPMASIGSDLAALYYVHERGGAAAVRDLQPDRSPAASRGEARNRPRSPQRARSLSPVSEGGRTVAIDAVARGSASILLADLRALGLEGGSAAGGVVSGRLPIRSLREAAGLSSLRGALPSRAQLHRGLVTSQADRALGAETARSRLDVDGSGEKICALSDSYDNLGGESDDVSSGDLPAGVDVLDDLGQDGSDEGRAMLQLIHDLAPGADLGFHTAFNGYADFASGIRELAGAGCTVIVDDIGYFAEPFYQDGLVSQAIDDVVADGATYFSSAGNSGRNSYEASFRDSGRPGIISPNEATLHDFDPGPGVDTRQRVRIPVGATFQITSLQWTDPSAFAGAQSATPDTDIDVALLNRNGEVVAASTRDNVESGVPWENLSYRNEGGVDTNNDGVADSTFQIAIERFSGPAPERLKYVYSPDPEGPPASSLLEYDTRSPTVYGHPMAEGAMAVAAAGYFNTPEFNPNVPTGATLQSFSSLGGLRIRFDESGNPIAPQRRRKPDVTGVDGTNNTFFGFDIPLDDDNFPNFFGTSAAAPHVAAVAALVQQALPDLSPEGVYGLLEETAEDVTERFDREGNAVDVPAGYDFFSGHGRVRAFEAAAPVQIAESSFGGSIRQVDTGSRPARVEASLQWQTSRERNSQGFIVEYRPDGPAPTGGRPAWTRAGFVASKAPEAGSTEPVSYDTTVALPSPGTYEFRLRNRQRTGSTIRFTEEAGQTNASLDIETAFDLRGPAPNPFSGRAQVRLVVDETQSVQVGLYDTMGRRVRLVYDGTVQAQSPLLFTVGGRPLASGMYFLRVDGETFSETRRAVRMR